MKASSNRVDVPLHLWVAYLFENATFGTALLFAAPLAGVFAGIRLEIGRAHV